MATPDALLGRRSPRSPWRVRNSPAGTLWIWATRYSARRWRASNRLNHLHDDTTRSTFSRSSSVRFTASITIVFRHACSTIGVRCDRLALKWYGSKLLLLLAPPPPPPPSPRSSDRTTPRQSDRCMTLLARAGAVCGDSTAVTPGAESGDTPNGSQRPAHSQRRISRKQRSFPCTLFCVRPWLFSRPPCAVQGAGTRGHTQSAPRCVLWHADAASAHTGRSECDPSAGYSPPPAARPAREAESTAGASRDSGRFWSVLRASASDGFRRAARGPRGRPEAELGVRGSGCGEMAYKVAEVRAESGALRTGASRRPCSVTKDFTLRGGSGTLQRLVFRNYYTAAVTVLYRRSSQGAWRGGGRRSGRGLAAAHARCAASHPAGPWKLLCRTRLMADCHMEDDAQAWHSVVVVDVRVARLRRRRFRAQLTRAPPPAAAQRQLLAPRAAQVHSTAAVAHVVEGAWRGQGERRRRDPSPRACGQFDVQHARFYELVPEAQAPAAAVAAPPAHPLQVRVWGGALSCRLRS